MLKQLLLNFFGFSKFNSSSYWESRYAVGGNSGDGSYGRLSKYKADFIQNKLKELQVTSVVEMGCGDGHQLSLVQYPSYLGLDVSPTIVKKCKQRFSNDLSKSFLVYVPEHFVPVEECKADLALSLDVIYHIIEERVYFKYLNDLFSLGLKFVIIYSTNFNESETQHVLHRKFSDDVEKLFPHWKLILHEVNPYQGKGEQESYADFFVYKMMI